MNQRIISTLHSLGLSETETKAYIVLLQTGKVTATVLSEKTDLKRSTARYTLDQLVKKRLATTEHKNSVFYFMPEPPERITHLLEAQKKQIEAQEVEAQSIVGDLKALMSQKTSLPKVQFFEGVEGVKRIIDDVLMTEETIYGALRMSPRIHPEIRKYIEEKYMPTRFSSDVKSYMIFNQNDLTEDYRQFDKKMNRTSLLVPKAEFPFDTCCHVYGDKVAFYSYLEDDLTGVLIQNRYIQKTQLALFKLAWDGALKFSINDSYRSVNL